MQREGWGSKIAFILAASGSAIGLGNIWRFPYQTGMNGGAAFVLIYLVSVVSFGVSLFLAEITLGRFTKRNPVGAFKTIKPNSKWFLVGILGIVTAIGILSYYAVIAGWTLYYGVIGLFKGFKGFTSETLVKQTFLSFSTNTQLNIFLLFVFVFLTVSVVSFGIKSGIEKLTKTLMPLLFVIIIYLAINSILSPGASKGLSFYLKPDFSKINPKVVLFAITQAFFSLSLGMGTMVTYGSYLSKDDYLPSSALLVSITDTFVAFMAGLIIFPILFTVSGLTPKEGPALVFIVLPVVFSKISGGSLFGTLFFFLLVIAALTSTVSLLEVPVAYFIDEKKWSRKKASLITGSLAFLLGIPSVLSFGQVKFLERLPIVGKPFLDLMDIVWGNLSLIVGALFLAIFVGYVWGINNAVSEIESGKKRFKLKKIWSFILKYFAPPTIIIILVAYAVSL